MKKPVLYTYTKSDSDFAKERGYSGYVSSPDGTRQWVESDSEGNEIVDNENKDLIKRGEDVHGYFKANPGIIHLFWSIMEQIKIMGMSLDQLYMELKERATPHIFGTCLKAYAAYSWDQFKAGLGTKQYAQGVDYWLRRMPAYILEMNISQITSDLIKKEMKSWKKNNGNPYKNSSLKTGQLIYQSAVTEIAKIDHDHNPFVFLGFDYKPTREYVSVDQWRLQLKWWSENEPRNLVYILHRGFVGRRHQELIGNWEYDSIQGKEVWCYTVLNRHLKPDEGRTRVDDTKIDKPQITYWPPAMSAWMKLAVIGGPDESILGVGVHSGKPLSQAAMEYLLYQSWRECFGRDVPYVKNWMRHTAATYAAAVFGPEIAAVYIGDSVEIIKKHYDGVADKKDGIAFFNSFPPGFMGAPPCLWDWWKCRADKEDKKGQEDK